MNQRKSQTQAEPILQYVCRKLGEHKGAWSEISGITKVPYFTLAKIYQGVTGNPRIGTLQPLADLFREIDSGARQLSCSKQAEQQVA